MTSGGEPLSEELEAKIEKLREDLHKYGGHLERLRAFAREIQEVDAAGEAPVDVFFKRMADSGHSYDAKAGIWWKDDSKPGVLEDLESALLSSQEQAKALAEALRQERERHYTPNPGLPFRGAWCKFCDDAWPCESVVAIDALIGGEDWPAIKAAYRAREAGRGKATEPPASEKAE